MTDLMTDFDLSLHVDNALAGRNLVVAEDHVGVVVGDLEVNAYKDVGSSPYNDYVEVRKAGELLSTFHDARLDKISFDIASNTMDARFSINVFQAIPSLIEEGSCAAHPNLSIGIWYEGKDGLLYKFDVPCHNTIPEEDNKATPHGTLDNVPVTNVS